MASPWAKISTPEPTNLKDIMSEEIAKNLQTRCLKTWPESDGGNSKEILYTTTEDFNLSDYSEEDDEENCEDIYDSIYWKQFCAIPSCVCIVKDAGVTTEPDFTLSCRRKTCKCMSFPQDLYSKDRATQQNQKDAKNVATMDFVVDLLTKIELCKMMNKQLLERIDGVMDVGKEAIILRGVMGPSNPCKILKECVLKVYKTTLTTFKKHEKHVWDDHFFKAHTGKRSVRKTMHLWAQKEALNLDKLKKAGVPCPEVIVLKKHILVMSLIGDEGRPALKLKDAPLKLDDYILAYNQVTQYMKNIYSKVNLIHADLSEHNILWHKGQCYFIDVAQSTEPSHEDAFLFLMQDCENITNFFADKSVPNIQTAEQLFMDITGCDNKNRVALEELRNSFKMKLALSS